MLTPPNEALVARDRALPGLGLLLDPKALADAIGTRVIQLHHLRYKPGTSCVAAVRTAEGGWLRLRALTPARFAEKDAGLQPLAAACIESGRPADDRDVPGLSRLWPERTRGKALAQLFGEGPLATARMVPLSYRLGRRLVARLDHPDGSALLKVHSQSRFAQAQAGALAAAMLGHAAVERACSRSFAVVTRWMPGATLCANHGAAGFAKAGAALAELHDRAQPLPFQRSRTDEIATVSRALADARALLPEMDDRLAQISRRLAEALAGTAADIGPIHGDFSADQVVIEADTACIIDWDRAGVGDRASDFGSALARLDAERIWGRLSKQVAQAAADALVEGYAAHRDLPTAMEAQRLAHLAALATEPFRRQATDWPGAVNALLLEVEHGLDRLQTSGPADVALPQLGTLLSSRGAQTLLDSRRAGRLVAPPRLLRHKTGRRALVEMRVEDEGGSRTWLVKTRSKRPDHVTPALHHALRSARFNESCEAPFAVPAAQSGPEGFRSHLMAHVAGRPLSEWQTPLADPAPFHAAGRALAALHAAEVDPDRNWNLENEAAVAEHALAAAAARRPEAAHDIMLLRARAAALPLAGLPGREGLLHRDFYPDQALVEGDRIWLIDLDLAARGNVHIDLGNMLAHLTESGLRQFGQPGALDRQACAFLAGYSAGGGEWFEEALQEMHAISLVRHLDICDRLPDRAHVFPALLAHLLTWTSQCAVTAKATACRQLSARTAALRG